MACTLDPNFTYKRLIDVDASARTKDELRARIKGKVALFGGDLRYWLKLLIYLIRCYFRLDSVAC